MNFIKDSIKETEAWLQLGFEKDIVPSDSEIAKYAINAYSERLTRQIIRENRNPCIFTAEWSKGYEAAIRFVLKLMYGNEKKLDCITGKKWTDLDCYRCEEFLTGKCMGD